MRIQSCALSRLFTTLSYTALSASQHQAYPSQPDWDSRSLYICPEHLTSNADGTQIVRSLMNYYVYHVAE